MKSQKGMATLLITTMLLVVSLLFSLASYKNAFYQIKRTQNEVLARQAHWLAEGGLECAFAKAVSVGGVPIDFNECDTLGLDSLSIDSATPQIITAIKLGAEIKKAIRLPGSGTSGAIKSTSNIYFAGGASMYPDPGKSAGNNKWECTALRYSNLLKVFGTIESKGLIKATPPYTGFPTTPTQSCLSSHHTTGVIGNYNIPSGLKSDFKQHPTLKPFYDLFDVPREQWLDVMYLEEFVRVGTSLPDTKPSSASLMPLPSFNGKCGAKIKDAISNKKDLIWVYGGCHLSEAELTNIDTAIANTAGVSGIILVIQDGIFSTKGSHHFKGMIFHFISSAKAYSPSETDWTLTENYSNLKGLVDYVPDTVPDIGIADVSYYQDGSFNPAGGYVMDAPDTYAVFRSSMAFIYNRDLIEEPLKKLKKIKWLEGSWHDF
ncbi:hypothetical protein [Photobacterium profundum]|uniref:Type 4 fimbrial biogenesis protein PilX N-terminal domain-containing protein n=1 Tax=Photobacterium profundum (strain SS9) TaxID=298386 RepID=Q6LUA2_PHOPR|nr:hypothetical protein [Photobacterium profundum]CAG19123.1 conserved hypothetical protein [Photobacterium profundum SS9]